VSELIFEEQDGVLWVFLNRPQVLNAMTPAQRDLLVSELVAVNRSPTIGAVVITGKGSGFCSGADLRPAPEVVSTDPGASTEEPMARVIRDGAQRLITSIIDCEKPVIAAVNGVAAGLGAHIAIASDLIIASTEASFIEVFVRRGLIPDGGGFYLLPRIVGIHKAKELMMLGERLDATEAHRIGLVNELVPPDALLETARRWAVQLAEGPRSSISLMKRLLTRSLDSTWTTMLDAEAVAVELNSHSADVAEGLNAFREGRRPQFRR